MVRIAGCAERWDRVGIVAPDLWRSAVEAVVAATRMMAPDGGSLTWVDEACALVVLRDAQQPRLGIRIRAHTLVILDRHAQLIKTLPLSELSEREARSWLTQHGFDGSGARDFEHSPDHEALLNLDRTLSNVHQTLGYVSRATDGADSVQSDPSTLDTTMDIRLSSREGEPIRRIVAGFTPEGDQGELFIQADPPTSSPERLTMRDLAVMSDVDIQATSVEAFFRQALEHAYEAVRREWRSRRPPAP